MTATYRPRWVAVFVLAAVAVAGAAFTSLPAASAAAIKTIKPLPASLSGYHLIKEFTGTDIAGPAWNAPANNPGGCPPNPAQISLTPQGAAEMQTTGDAGNCVEAESPQPYPTTAGYVYEASVYDSSFKDWGGFWSYGNNWPGGGEMDTVETIWGQNYVSYHYGYDNTTLSTGPWEHQRHTLNPVGKNITIGWHIIDVAYFANKIEVFYDGHLYVAIVSSHIARVPAWIVFGDGSCKSATYNSCASASDIGLAGNFKVKWLRIFRQ
jgi:hypothetical protein